MYTNIGMKRRSSMAFRLGCENLIDIERFMEHHCFSEGSKKKDKESFDFYAGIPDKHNAYFAAHMIAGEVLTPRFNPTHGFFGCVNWM